jgi:hypothetical protein
MQENKAAWPMDLNNSLKAEAHFYDQDGLRSVHNHEFMGDPSFRRAYERGVRATGRDYARDIALPGTDR